MYKSKNHGKFTLKYHIILVVKYRRKILKGSLRKAVKSLCLEIAQRSDFDIAVLETDIDHIHLLVDSVPSVSPLMIVKRLKQETTFRLWKSYPNVLRKYFWREKTLWTDGYFVCTTGDACTKTIIEYIENQG